MTRGPSRAELAAELQAVRIQLADAEELLRAIRGGHVDGVLVAGERGEQVYTLRGADHIYRQLIETMSEGAATLASDGSILYCNAHVAELLGRGLEHILGTALRTYVPPADQPALRAILAQARTETGRGEIGLTHSDGRLVPVYVSAFQLQTDAVEDVFLLVLTDLTQQRSHEQIVAAEKALRKSEEEFRSLAEAMPQIVWATLKDGWNVYLNQQWVDYTGLTLEQSYGRGWVVPFHPDDQQRAMNAWQDALQGVGRYSVECRLRRTDGVYKWWLIRGVPMLDSAGDILKWFGTCTDIDDIKRTEATLRENEQRLAEAQALAKLGNWETDLVTTAVIWSEEIYRLFGIERGSVAASHAAFLSLVHPEDRADTEAAFVRSFETRSVNTIEHRIVTPDGAVKFVEERWRILPDGQGRPARAVGTTQDITDSKQAAADKAMLEAQLQEAQKMDSVGRLAGGVAHDFNNMLGVILGHAELALNQVGPHQQVHADLEAICHAATRSANLTRQLLTFARKQAVAPKILDLNHTVADMLTMLHRLIGEDVDLRWQPGTNLWRVKMDPSQVDQVLVNLCVNARDAIGGVGMLRIETANCTLDDRYCADHAGSAPGEYVRLTVRDNGCGMAKETVPFIFEPFFTTKAIGKGTGLGLATVYGIVMQNRGYISVDSQPGQGTSFEIYLPRQTSAAEETRVAGAAPALPTGHETVLVVEDESTILSVATRMLERQGYTVLGASAPGDALRMATAHGGAINLLLTDVIMPDMNGRALAEALRSVRPDLKLLFMSGYTAEVIAHQGVLDEGVHFIQKPFTSGDLATKVRDALDAPI